MGQIILKTRWQVEGTLFYDNGDVEQVTLTTFTEFEKKDVALIALKSKPLNLPVGSDLIISPFTIKRVLTLPADKEEAN